MIKKWFLYVFILFGFLATTVAGNDDKPVVIALAPFCDFSNYKDSTSAITSLRDKVTANLLQNYNCIILSRSNGLLLSTEHQLNYFNQLDKKTFESIVLPTADFAITGLFKIERRTEGEKQSVGLGCSLFITDLHNENEKNFKKIEFFPDEKTFYADDVTQKIVKALNLKPKKHQFKKHEGLIDETWAVVPIKRIKSKNTTNKSADRDLAISMELALQESKKLKQIVDHNEIDKLLNELKIASMNGATESAAGKIAQLIGADKIIMGSVSIAHKLKKDLRIDLFLVDGKTAIIVDSASLITSQNKLNEKISELVLKFVERKNKIPELNNASPKLLKKEAVLYEEILNGLRSALIPKNDILDMSMTYAETIYMLVNKDDARIYNLAVFFTNFLGLKNKDLSSSKKHELAELIDKLLKPIRYSEKTEYILLYRAKALSFIPERFDEAIRLANQHLQEHPDLNPEYTLSVIGEIYFRKENYQKALEYGEKTGLNIGGNRLLVKIYRKLNDPANDKKELKCLKILHVIDNEMGYDVVRRLELTHKIEGPKAALNYFNRLSSWTRVRPEILLETAKINLALGNKTEAASIIHGIANEQVLSQSRLPAMQKNALKKEVYRLKKELNEYCVKWKTFGEVMEIPKKYRFYIQPMGNVDRNLLNNAVPLIEEYSGCRVVILPLLPFPEDPYCYKKERGQYNSYHVLKRLKRLIPLPEDAIAVSEVTSKDIYCLNLRFVYGSPYYGRYLLSYHQWLKYVDDFVLTEMIAKSICGPFETHVRLRSCSQPVCLASNDGTSLGPRDKKFLLCPDCSQKVSKKSAEDIYNYLRYRYGIRKEFEDSDKPKWDEDYNIIIQKTLSDAKKKAEDEAKQPIDYLPAITLDSPKSGLKFKYYEFKPVTCKSTADLQKLTPTESGITDTFSLSKSKKDNQFGLEFDGYINIPVDGEYQFYLSSSCGSRLTIGDKEVVNNDGIHPPATKSANIALKAGYHPIKLLYFLDELKKKKGRKRKRNKKSTPPLLTLYYRGPETLGQKIPADVLSYKEVP